MKRYRERIKQWRKWRIGWKTPLLLVSLAAAMVACGDKQGPMPPLSPPRPVTTMTTMGRVVTADLVVNKRPQPRRCRGSGTM